MMVICWCNLKKAIGHVHAVLNLRPVTPWPPAHSEAVKSQVQVLQKSTGMSGDSKEGSQRVLGGRCGD